MEADYIQLPPMPSDTPTEVVAVVWVYVRIEKPEKEQFLDFMRENLKPGTSDGEKEKLMELMEKLKLKPSPYVGEFHSLMQELIGRLIAQSCEMSALIYQKYCVEEKSIKEISETIHVPQNAVELMARTVRKNEIILSQTNMKAVNP